MCKELAKTVNPCSKHCAKNTPSKSVFSVCAMNMLKQYIIKISIVSSNRTKYLTMHYVSATKSVVEPARGTWCCKTDTYWWFSEWTIYIDKTGSVSMRLSKWTVYTCTKICIDQIRWTASSEFGTYRLCEQRRFRRACASAQSRQNLRCSLIQAVSQEEPSDRKPDPWLLWMAGHAQLKFVMTECSKTQIRLTGLRWS